MVIKKLTKDLINDWFDFFDNRAFADHNEWNTCYCTAFYKPRPTAYNNNSKKNRDYAGWLIESGEMTGYMAFEEGKVIGWVNSNNRIKYPGLNKLNDMNEKILSIVCFIVEKEYRGKGIATKLLEKVILDAKSGGYTLIEAYPKKRAKSEFGTWNGPFRMYEKAGFAEYEIDGINVVRKVL